MVVYALLWSIGIKHGGQWRFIFDFTIPRIMEGRNENGFYSLIRWL